MICKRCRPKVFENQWGALEPLWVTLFQNLDFGMLTSTYSEFEVDPEIVLVLGFGAFGRCRQYLMLAKLMSQAAGLLQG